MDLSTFFQYDFSNSLAASLAAAANLGLLLVANRALKQIDEQRKQISLTKQMAAINELRSFESFVGKSSDTLNKIKERRGKKPPIPRSEMENFTLNECSNEEFKRMFNNWHEFYNGNMDLFGESISCANSLEVIATSLRYGIADMKVIESAIGSVFCEFVESSSYIYVSKRTDANMLYDNTIYIYKLLKPAVRSLNEQNAGLEAQIKNIFGSK